jgi:hypothetical protein
MRSTGSFRLLATALAVAALAAALTKVCLAQIPEAPGTFTDSNGVKILQPPWGSPQSKKEREEKATAGAGETPTPEPTPR